MSGFQMGHHTKLTIHCRFSHCAFSILLSFLGYVFNNSSPKYCSMMTTVTAQANLALTSHNCWYKSCLSFLVHAVAVLFTCRYWHCIKTSSRCNRCYRHYRHCIERGTDDLYHLVEENNQRWVCTLIEVCLVWEDTTQILFQWLLGIEFQRKL